MIYFSSDFHMGHSNIIGFCRRPHVDLHDMHKGITDNWNSRVTSSDIGYILGDFGFGSKEKLIQYRSLFNGKIILIKGNHDKGLSTCKEIFDEAYSELNIDTIFGKTLLTHKPVVDFRDCTINLCGHVHEKWKFNKHSSGKFHVNVGVDQWSFKPHTDKELFDEFNLVNAF